MPLLNRDTLVDRPVLVDRGSEEDEEEKQEEETIEVQTLGNGGGPEINHLEFEEGHYEIVAASNLAAVLATGREEGTPFEDAFTNAAIQLYELDMQGEDISDLVRFAVEKNVAEIGLTEAQIRRLRGQPARQRNGRADDEEVESETHVGQVEDESDVEDLQEEIQSMREAADEEEEEQTEAEDDEEEDTEQEDESVDDEGQEDEEAS